MLDCENFKSHSHRTYGKKSLLVLNKTPKKLEAWERNEICYYDAQYSQEEIKVNQEPRKTKVNLVLSK